MYLNDRLGRHQRPAEGKGGELESGTEVKKANQDLVSKVKNIPSHKYNIKNEKDDFWVCIFIEMHVYFLQNFESVLCKLLFLLHTLPGNLLVDRNTYGEKKHLYSSMSKRLI